jgi:Lipase (class 3)
MDPANGWFGDIGISSIDLTNDPSYPSFFSYNDGYYYNDSSGFVGRIIEADGKAFVVFRGSDLSSSDPLDLLRVFRPEPADLLPGAGNVADPYDWSNDFNLLVGTVGRTQLDDALALLELAKQHYSTDQIIVTGQSLGGGLASLVTAIQNESESNHQVQGYAVAPAPFAAQLHIEAALLALKQAGFTRDNVLGRDGSVWAGVKADGVTPEELSVALLDRSGDTGALAATLRANGVSEETTRHILDRVAEIESEWASGVPGLSGYRIQGRGSEFAWRSNPQ